MGSNNCIHKAVANEIQLKHNHLLTHAHAQLARKCVVDRDKYPHSMGVWVNPFWGSAQKIEHPQKN